MCNTIWVMVKLSTFGTDHWTIGRPFSEAKQVLTMAVPSRINLVFCAAALLSSCGGNSGENNNDGLVVPLENTSTNMPVTMLDARQINILDRVKQRSAADGAQYDFDKLNPVFVQDGDTVTVNFSFINPNTVGGAPIVEYSLAQSEIISIVYTR